MSVPILPCPFCCSAAKFGEVTMEGDNFGGQFIECTNPQCGCSTRLMFPLMDSVKELLAETWNRRTSESILRKDAESASALEKMIAPIRVGVSDVIHSRLIRTGEIPEALDVELGFVNGGPDTLHYCVIGGERYIHANDLAGFLGILPREDPLCAKCGNPESEHTQTSGYRCPGTTGDYKANNWTPEKQLV